MKVILTGLPHFSRRTAGFLSQNGTPGNRFVSCDLTTRSGQARFLVELPTADTVLSFWGTITESRALALALRLRKRVIQFWAGSDVLAAARVAGSSAISPSLLHGCTHLCEADWTRDELAAIGIEATTAPLPVLDPPPPTDDRIGLPRHFSIFGYVGKGSERFYGLDHFLRLAASLPDVPIVISGTDDIGPNAPTNIRAIGWTADPAAWYEECVLFLRVPEHDGFSFSVREALSWGRHVVASYPYPHCLVATDYGSLELHVNALRQRFLRGDLGLNEAGRESVLTEYAAPRVRAELMRVLSPRP